MLPDRLLPAHHVPDRLTAAPRVPYWAIARAARELHAPAPIAPLGIARGAIVSRGRALEFPVLLATVRPRRARTPFTVIHAGRDR